MKTASRFDRLKARLIDDVPPLLLAGLFIFFLYIESILSDSPKYSTGSGVVLFGIVLTLQIISAIAFVVWIGTNLRLMAKEGTTIGKNHFDMKIVDAKTGHHVGFARNSLVRGFVVQGLLSKIFIFGVANYLFIFGRDRRCLHDYFSGTVVIYNESSIF